MAGKAAIESGSDDHAIIVGGQLWVCRLGQGCVPGRTTRLAAMNATTGQEADRGLHYHGSMRVVRSRVPLLVDAQLAPTKYG